MGEVMSAANYIYIIELKGAGASQKSIAGYGRDIEEALSHSGEREDFLKCCEVNTVLVSNDLADEESNSICSEVCDFHLTKDEETPFEIKLELNKLVKEGLYADAVSYCFDMIWDRGFEE